MKITDSTLEKHIVNNKIAPSYLLVDKDILKLQEIAKWFSKAGGFYIADIFWLTPKEGNTIKVEETENFIGKSSYAAIKGKKLLVICDAAAMTPTAQNKILKTIEDVENGTSFLLLASASESVLNTIKSRCVTVYCAPLSADTVDCYVKQLLPNHALRPKEFNDGTLTGAVAYMSNKSSAQIYANVEKLLMTAKTLDDALPLLPVLTAKENFELTLAAFNHYLNYFLKTSHFTIQKINAILTQLAIINRNIAANCNAQNCFDMLLMELFN